MERSRRDEHIHWGWVIVCACTGIALIGVAFLVEARWRWVGTAPSVFVELGAAFLLAGVLFVVEQRFTRRATRVTETRIREVEARVDERTRGLERRLDEIQGATQEHVQRRDAARDDTLAALDADVSYRTVTRAIEEANGLNASVTGTWTVEASPNVSGLRVTFSWGYYTDDSFSGVEPRVPVLEVEADVEQRPGEVGRPIIRVRWEAADAVESVGARLIEALRKEGRWQGEETLDWGVALANLQRTLRVAVASRRRDPNAWHLNGALYELVGQSWAITEGGVECPDRDFLLPGDDFPERMGRRRLEEFRPERPAWADETEWRVVIDRARPHFPRRGLGFTLYEPSWVPITPTTM